MNIFEIKNSLAKVFADIEDNGGELTPELEAELNSVNESLTDKVQGYVAFIKDIDNNINLIKAEQARLKKLAETKNNLKQRLEKILVDLIIDLGDVSKTGTKFIDYGLGKISLRKSTSVEVNDIVAEGAVKSVFYSLQYLKETNQLDTVDHIDSSNIIDFARNANYNDEDEESYALDLTENDLNNISTEITLKVNIADLINGKAYELAKQLVEFTSDYKIKPSVSKTELKSVLQENGSACPNLAKLSNNYSLTIK